MKIPKREYTAEFKELSVKRVKEGQTVGAVCKELGLVEQTLRNWVKASVPSSPSLSLNGFGIAITAISCCLSLSASYHNCRRK
ncbi:MAG: transposase [Nitrospirae bacterium]|nr:transposase [Nitrospirota bacterium]